MYLLYLLLLTACRHRDVVIETGAVDADGDGLFSDDDCDDTDAEVGGPTSWYADQDGDSYGAGKATSACDPPSGTVANRKDCDDGNAKVHPSANELCSTPYDDDCDGAVNEDASDADPWYADTDGDGYGDPEVTITSCDQASGTVANDEDCDDDDSDVNPDADELCSTAYDDDCDGTANEDDAVDASTWYADTDGDGYGDPNSTTAACKKPNGYTTNKTDCDDTSKLINPGRNESCNGLNDDCDANVDETVLGSGSDCPAGSCLEILEAGILTDGIYTLEGGSGTTYSAYCDQSTDNGGWTLVGSVVNEINTTGSHDRNWDSYSAWTDDSTTGSIGDRQSADYKSEAWVQVDGDDLMILTDEYGFAFYNLVGGQPYGDHIAAEYSSSCSENFLASGADFYTTLSATEAAAFVYIIRPKDTNAQCFPNSSENAIVGLQLESCCWAGGLGNTPSGYPTWEIYDNSLLKLTRIAPKSCTAGLYPCNDNGYYTEGFAYTYESKVTWAEIYLR